MKQIIRKAFKFRLSPDSDAIQKMVEQSGATRFVWNKTLSMNLLRLENKSLIARYSEMNFWLKLWKDSEECGFLKKADSQAIQQSQKQLDRAFKDAFDKKQPLKRMPVFKRKGVKDSFTYPQRFKLDQANSKIYLPKIGWVKYRNSQQVVGDMKNCTVSRRGNHWYVSIQVEYEAPIPHHVSKTAVGIDMGIKRFATLSTGDVIEPLNSFKKLEKKLAFEQRKLSKKVKFSSNWKKQKHKITNLHERIANARNDFLHKTSETISKSHAMIMVEDLKVRNMSRSAKGNEGNPGRNVSAKSGLNKSILDQGWGNFIRMLEYKQLWRGGQLEKVDPKYTSQTCPCCHHVSKDNRLTQSNFICVECGFSENADLVGALNILERGHRLLACGETGLPVFVKQEPLQNESLRV